MHAALRGFIAGFVATLTFHQATLGLLWTAGAVPRAPWSLAPVAPLGVPAVISLAFWGGLWGVVLVALLSRVPARSQPLAALVFGAIAPSLVAWYVVAPLKGRAPPTTLQGMWVGLVVNAAWGVGTWLIARALARRAAAPPR